MPVAAYPGPNSHVGNGVTTVFAYSYRIIDESDLLVTVDGVLQTLTTHYTVAGEGDAGGGSITFVAAPANLSAVIIQRLRPYTRATDYQRNGSFDEETVDRDFDSEEMQIQQVAAAVARAFKAPVEVVADQVLTSAEWTARASKFLGFNAAAVFGLYALASAGNLAVSAFIETLLDDADAAAARATLGAAASGSAFTTGDVKLTIKTVADAGWVLMDDTTIGNAASGATGRANADTVDLFTLLWANTADAQCAVSTGRGASAAADYAVNKTIALPKALGRALATYGAGSGLTARVLALTFGVETHALTENELTPHTHSWAANQNSVAGATPNLWSGDGSGPAPSIVTTSKGNGVAHPNMQPTLFLNTMIKL